MRQPSLTQESKLLKNKVLTTYQWQGRSVEVFDSTANAILLLELFNDQELTGEEKSIIVLLRLFPRSHAEYYARELTSEELTDLLTTILWDAFGLDISEEHKHETSYDKPVFDFDKDAARIKASFMQAYGLDLAEYASKLPYVDFCGLVGTLMESGEQTPLSEAITYRTAKPPKTNKYNKEERERFNALRKHYAMNANVSASDQNDATEAMFEAALREAGGK